MIDRDQTEGSAVENITIDTGSGPDAMENLYQLDLYKDGKGEIYTIRG